MKSERNTLSGSSVISFLKILSKAQLREFEKFLKSPFHNKRKDVIIFFNELKKHYPDFVNTECNKLKIYKNMYPGEKKYRDDVLRRLSSNLLKAGEEFGAYMVFRENKILYNNSLTKFYLSKSSLKLLDKQIQKTFKTIENTPGRDAEYFLNINYAEEFKRLAEIRKDSSGKNIDLQKQIDSVWKFSLITLLRLYKTANEHSRQFEKNYDTSKLKYIDEIIKSCGFMGSKVLEIWYLLLKFQKEQRNDNTFFRMKKIISSVASMFEPSERFVVYVTLLGYCFEKNIYSPAGFHKEEFEIITEMLKNDVLIQDNVFHPEWFMFAVISALRADEVNYAENFINTYGKLLPRSDGENVLNHSKAELEIEKGNYESALNYLKFEKYNNIAEKLRAKHMYIKIYFELGLSDMFFFNSDSFKHLIKNDSTLSNEAKIIRENFIKYAIKLFKIKLGESSEDAGKILKEILVKPINGKKWLIKKAAELINKR